MYRPQFPFPTPKDCVDEDVVYVFNANNLPVLGNAIAGGTQLLNIPLNLDPDAPFLWRGFMTQSGNPGIGLAIQFRDPSGNLLSDGFVPIPIYSVPAGSNNPLGISGNQGTPVLLEADAGEGQGAIFCPAGATIQINFYNPTGSPITPPTILFSGVKRYPRELRRNC